MTELTPEALYAQLQQKQQELDLIRSIDQLRDSVADPAAMSLRLVSVLADHFQADLGLACTQNRETGQLELTAALDCSGRFGQLDIKPGSFESIVAAGHIGVYQDPDASALLGLPAGQERLYLAVVPVVLGADSRLGAILMARSHAPFSAGDLALLDTAESQIDSALTQVYTHFDLVQRTKELETIYRVDRIRDQRLPLDEMLNAVLCELCATIQAETGFIMLYNRLGHQLELRATTHEDLFRVSRQYQVLDRIANEALQQARLVCYNELDHPLRSCMCIPLILCDEIIGVLGMVNRRGPRGFEVIDRQLLTAIGSQMDTAIFESLERRRLREVLGRSVDPRVMERLLENADLGFLKGERMVLSVLYSDIRGSTYVAEQSPPELLVAFINDYLGRMTDVILAHQGTLDKFVGDEVMALFGAPVPQPDHALRAVRVGLALQVAHQGIMETWRVRGLPPAPIGVGIATGELTVGEMGSTQRTDYTVIGRAANLGARLCSVAQGGQVLVSQETYELVRERVEAVPVSGLQLKGIPHPVTAYHVTRVI